MAQLKHYDDNTKWQHDTSKINDYEIGMTVYTTKGAKGDEMMGELILYYYVAL